MTRDASSGASRAARIACAFAALFLVNAAALAWLPVWLEGRGLDGEAVGLVIAAVMTARFIAAPTGGYAADALGRPRAVMIAAALALLAAHLGFAIAGGLAAFLLAALVMGAGLGPSVPLLEATTVRLAGEQGGPGFGPMRAAGTVAFIVATLTLGRLVAVFGERAIILWLIAASAAYAVAAALLPTPRRPRLREPRRPPVLPALMAPPLLAALLASALIQGSHAFYYGFASIAWRGQGLGDGVIGALWAWGAVVEVGILVLARRLEPVGPARLMAIGAACAAVRWLAMGVAPGLGWLVGLQMLHGGSFALAHLGFILFVREHAPPHAAATAQAVNSALTFGGVLAAATALSGVLFDLYGARGYWSMALLAAAGLAAALGLVLLMRSKRA